MRTFTLPFRRARHLPGGSVEAVEEIGCGDDKDQSREPLLVVVPASFVPDLVWDRVRTVGETGGGLGEREGSPFGVGEVGRLPPGRHSKESLVCFACLLRAACAVVKAEATAIDLARAQVDKLKRLFRHRAVSLGLAPRAYSVHRCVNRRSRLL